MENECRPEKKAKLSEMADLSEFSIKELLRVDTEHKVAFLHAVHTHTTASAVVIVEKKTFTKDHLEKVLATRDTLKLHAQNDIYGNYDYVVPADFEAYKTTVIYPATEKHVDKFREQELHWVTESPEDYQNVTLPHINQSSFSLQWVTNFLEHKAETDRVIFEDPDPQLGFMMAPDLKWDGTSVENLYVTAIVRQSGIKSLRDLSTEHLPLLRNIQEAGTKAIETKYKVMGDQLRVFLHYQPSYYHLHVHFVTMKWDAPGTGAGKAHILQDVIDNITQWPDYYQKKNMTFVLKENDPLFDKLTAYHKKG